MRGIHRLDNQIMPYAWGSRRAIAELQGRPAPSAEPEAELWMGVHPRGPSRVRVGDRWIPLPGLIAARPAEVLGAEISARFDAQLPFLLKVLAAAEPLSIQAHPSLAQARAGFAREQAAGVPIEAPERCYRDANHKPELICALTPFTALCGFRRPDEALRLIEQLGVAGLEQVLAPLRRYAGRVALSGFLSALLGSSPAQQRELAQQASSRARALSGADPAYVWVERLARRYPEDGGVLAPLFLNLVALAPGQALFLGPGRMHSYLEGTGLEIMADSDNVLRGGLTPKHVNVAELLEILDDDGGPAQLVWPEAGARGEQRYPVDVAEFRLARIGLRPGAPYSSGPRAGVELLLCVEGDAVLRPEAGADSGEHALARGDALLVEASAAPYELSGEAVVFCADVPAA